jgi:hypothetical protein
MNQLWFSKVAQTGFNPALASALFGGFLAMNSLST